MATKLFAVVIIILFKWNDSIRPVLAVWSVKSLVIWEKNILILNKIWKYLVISHVFVVSTNNKKMGFKIILKVIISSFALLVKS